MNERIRELAEQAGFMEAWFSESGDDCEREIKKFAELIVEECAKICDVVRESNGGDKQFGARLCADEIRWMNRRSK
jgi:hypothetical protein